MSAAPIAIKSVGLVTSVGLTAEASCAAFRAKVSNPTETRFIDSAGEWIMAHQVALEQPWRGLSKLAKMAAMAIEEALQDVPKKEWCQLPLLLCVAEKERPGRIGGLDDQLLALIQADLGIDFASGSGVIAHGRVGVALALAHARSLLDSSGPGRVLVAATDSLVTWPTLSRYEMQDRLLTPRNSNGFVPGEAGAAVVVAKGSARTQELVCTGIGFGQEAATIDSGEPLRAEGLSLAIKSCLSEAQRGLHEMDLRITDGSGEQYYFKEAALALSRTLRHRRNTFDLWQPAECIGETGAVSGLAITAAARHAHLKAYANGLRVLAHCSNDAGQRAALSFEYRAAA